ncbi:MAG: hypothetical protein ABIP28_12155 [Mucilaginibacter sp.]
MPTHLFNVFFDALDGSTLAGPVTMDKDEYLFVNKNSLLDVYFNLKKGDDGWYLSGGPATHGTPQQYVEAVGAEIDKFREKK